MSAAPVAPEREIGLIEADGRTFRIVVRRAMVAWILSGDVTVAKGMGFVRGEPWLGFEGARPWPEFLDADVLDQVVRAWKAAGLRIGKDRA